jgi:prolipoprotein diacylglyceryltransferase
MYFWWKMGRDEHWDEIALFDGFFLSTIVYLVVGRIGYVLLHISELDTLYRSLALLAYPGINEAIGIAVAIIFMVLFARGHDWDEWKVLDACVVALAMVLVMGGLGAVLNGSNSVWQANVWLLTWAIVTLPWCRECGRIFGFMLGTRVSRVWQPRGLASLIFVFLLEFTI